MDGAALMALEMRFAFSGKVVAGHCVRTVPATDNMQICTSDSLCISWPKSFLA